MAEILASISENSALIYAVLGGILPALFWLWFWTQEDKLHPEPRMRLFFCFIGGMACVALAYFPQRWIFGELGSPAHLTFPILLAWAAIEEIVKYGVVAIAALHSKDCDEPVDVMIYFVTVALGFAALENTAFILKDLITDGAGIIVGNERFIGASIVHVVSSSLLGFCIALEFYKKLPWKIAMRVVGLSLAIAVHTGFNIFVVHKNGNNTMLAFGLMWMMALVILLLFEKIKKLKQSN